MNSGKKLKPKLPCKLVGQLQILSVQSCSRALLAFMTAVPRLRIRRHEAPGSPWPQCTAENLVQAQGSPSALWACSAPGVVPDLAQKFAPTEETAAARRPWRGACLCLVGLSSQRVSSSRSTRCTRKPSRPPPPTFLRNQLALL